MLAETPRSARPALNLATSVTSTQWHATWNLPTKIAEPNKITAFTYANANATTGMGAGNLTGRSETQTTDATGAAKFTATQAAGTPIKSTGWSYNSTSSLPNTIVERETAYGSTTATQIGKWTYTYNSLGDTTSVKDVQVTPNPTGTLATFNATGLPLTGKGVDGRTFSLSYRPDNQISKLSFSDGYFVDYIYNSKSQLAEARASDGGLATLEYGADGRPTRYVFNGQVIFGAPLSSAQKGGVQPSSAAGANTSSTVRPVPMPEIDWSGLGRGAGRFAAACATRVAAVLMAVIPDTTREDACADDPRKEKPECKKNPESDECKQLRAEVQNAKAEPNSLGACKAGMSRYDLNIRHAAWLRLAIARERRDMRCYVNDDPGHQQARAQAWANVGTCATLLSVSK